MFELRINPESAVIYWFTSTEFTNYSYTLSKHILNPSIVKSSELILSTFDTESKSNKEPNVDNF